MPTARNVEVVFVTTDPARDTEPVHPGCLDHFDPTSSGSPVPLATIMTVAERVGVPIEKGRRLPSGGYDVTHGTQVLAHRRHDEPDPRGGTLGTTAPEFAARHPPALS